MVYCLAARIIESKGETERQKKREGERERVRDGEEEK